MQPTCRAHRDVRRGKRDVGQRLGPNVLYRPALAYSPAFVQLRDPRRPEAPGSSPLKVTPSPPSVRLAVLSHAARALRPAFDRTIPGIGSRTPQERIAMTRPGSLAHDRKQPVGESDRGHGQQLEGAVQQFGVTSVRPFAGSAPELSARMSTCPNAASARSATRVAASGSAASTASVSTRLPELARSSRPWFPGDRSLAPRSAGRSPRRRDGSRTPCPTRNFRRPPRRPDR